VRKKNPLAPASISGAVSFQGQPIKGGTVQFFTPEGTAYSAQIGPDGTYSVSDVPEGELIITVETESVNPARKAAAAGKDMERREKIAQQPPPDGRGSGPAAAEKAASYLKIPEKYGNPKTSPLTVTVKSGRLVHPIELN